MLNGILIALYLALVSSLPAQADVYGPPAPPPREEKSDGIPFPARPDELTPARQALLLGDYQSAIQLLQPLADRGYPDAECEIGRLYWLGHGVKKDWLAAAQWFRKAAEKGNIEAQAMLGTIYAQDGFGIKQDFAEALKWDRAVAGRSAEAAFNLGQLYLKGDGVRQDYEEAYYWLSTGAKNDGEAALRETANHLSPEQKAAVEQRLKQRLIDRADDRGFVLPKPPK